MALTLRSNGTSAATLVGASWWNDYYNLLTGAMVDQPVTLSYAPGSSTSTPTLQLKTNGNAPMLQGFNGATQKFQMDANGLLTDGGSNSYAVLVHTGTATAGRQIFVGTATPTGANEGDIWVKA